MEQSIVVLKRDCTGPVARRQKTLAKCVIAYRVRYNLLVLLKEGLRYFVLGSQQIIDGLVSDAHDVLTGLLF